MSDDESTSGENVFGPRVENLNFRSNITYVNRPLSESALAKHQAETEARTLTGPEYEWKHEILQTGPAVLNRRPLTSEESRRQAIAAAQAAREMINAARDINDPDPYESLLIGPTYVPPRRYTPSTAHARVATPITIKGQKDGPATQVD